MSRFQNKFLDQFAYRKVIGLAILLILFVTSLGISKHYHYDQRDHNDCLVCVLSSTLSTPPELPATPLAYVQIDLLDYPLPNTPLLISQNLGRIYLARAPPV